MNRWKAAGIAIALVLSLASVGQATDKFTCNSGGRLWSLVAGDYPLEIDLTMDKNSTDCDIGVFESETGGVVALGLGVVPRYEIVVFGGIPGVGYDIVILKVSGPNSKSYLRIADDTPINRPESRSRTLLGAGVKLQDRGRLGDLARSHPRYRRMAEQMKSYRAIKDLLRTE
jgi:hypothetical protein